MLEIDLEPDDLARVRSILAEHVPQLAVYAFGSRVRGGARPGSDLDLVLMTDSPLPLRRLARLMEALRESDLPFPVDIVDWSATDTSFRELISSQAVLLQTGFDKTEPQTS